MDSTLFLTENSGYIIVGVFFAGIFALILATGVADLIAGFFRKDEE
jgi:hypothetical protein